MNYPNVESYLKSEVLVPLRKALEKGDKEEVMQIAEYICEKYIEINAAAKFYENLLGRELTAEEVKNSIDVLTSSTDKVSDGWDDIEYFDYDTGEIVNEN